MTTSYGGGYGGGGGGVKSIITRDMFEEMLKHRNDQGVAIRGFYTYDAFIEATRAFPDFGTTGDIATRRRELAAFFAQTSHETTGGWDGAPDGRYAWGYCFNREQDPKSSYCDINNQEYPCAPGRRYFGRGPKQLSWNYNYGQCGRALGVDLLNNPDLLITDPVLSFKSAIWFWMTPQPPKPSCHDVMIGNWHPSRSDMQAGRVPGYGVLTNIINGGVESGHGWDERVESRIGFFKRYCSLLRVDYGNEDTLHCYHQRPFA